MAKAKNAIGINLNRIKKDLGLTREEMAKILDLEVKTLDRYIEGDRDPNTVKVKKIAADLNVTICDLFGQKCSQCAKEN